MAVNFNLETFSVEKMLGEIDDGFITIPQRDLDPGNEWTLVHKQQFIDMLRHDKPLPRVLLRKLSKYESPVLDVGYSWLNVLDQFINGAFPINRLYFSDLSWYEQDLFMETKIPVVVCDDPATTEAQARAAFDALTSNDDVPRDKTIVRIRKVHDAMVYAPSRPKLDANDIYLCVSTALAALQLKPSDETTEAALSAMHKWLYAN